MPVYVVSNDIGAPPYQKQIGGAVLEGVGDRPDDEFWEISIHEAPDSQDLIVTISGPNDFIWTRRFSGPHENNPEFIREEIKKALPL
jgi:hypothetical protein